MEVESHPLLRVRVFEAEYPAPLADIAAPPLDTPPPMQRNEEVRKDIRDMLRTHGYKPTGRGKPASEYLVRAYEGGLLGPINAAVDACNLVSLHSGLPVSVVDLDRATPPFRIATAPEGERYVFNASGQEIDLGGLICIFDADGPCGNAVKDSQRTKTSDATRRTLSVIWGCAAHERRLDRALAWYAELVESSGASISYRVR
ncbi:MAG: phenylalanine--tRNA ligase beta subunit-related protein [Planctomycetota bacterium]|jgi:DNA/RNA-binding domain of Phe-tRNA-synthetase-like protein